MIPTIRFIALTFAILFLGACGTVSPRAPHKRPDAPLVMFSMLASTPVATADGLSKSSVNAAGAEVFAEAKKLTPSDPESVKASGPFRGPWVVRFKAIHLDNVPTYSGQTMSLQLFPDITRFLHVDKWDFKEDKHVLRGHLDESGFATLVFDSSNQALGTIELKGGNVLVIHSIENQQYALEIDPRKFLDEKSYLLSPGPHPTTQPPPSGQAGVLKILLVSSNDALFCPWLQRWTPFFEQQFNDVFSKHGANVQVQMSSFCSADNLIGATLDDSLINVSQNVGVANERATVRADLVSLIIPSAEDGSGVAQYNFPILPTDSNRPYSVVLFPSAVTNYSLLHEVGHNLGMQHDRNILGGGDQVHCNYGAFIPSEAAPVHRTIMAEGAHCATISGGCPRTPDPVFSTPPLSGVDCSDAVNGANNRAQLLIGAVEASRFFFP
jgi:hypothetical protein